MIIGAVIQQPVDILDYDIDYSRWFSAESDSLESIEVDYSGLDQTLNVAAVVSMNNIIKLWIQGGKDGETYTVEVTVTTASGRKKQDELLVTIEDY